MKRGHFWRWLGITVLGLVLYLVFLLVFAPADYVARAVTYFSRNTLVLQQPVGTLWHGSGVLVFGRTDLPSPSLPPSGQVQWAIHPWKLLTASLVTDLQFTGEETDVRGTLDLGLRRHILRDVVASAPVSSVASFYPAAAAIGLGGRIRVTTTTFEIRKESVHGTVELLWENAASRLLPITPVGDYKLQLVGQEKRISLRLGTVQGLLQIAADGEWRLLEDGTLRFQGTLASATPQPALEPLLNAIGPLQSDGRRSFSYDTRLTPFKAAALFPL